MTPILVTVRMTGGAYLARHKKAMASSTSNPYEAAARAASKFFGVIPTRILLQRAPDCSHFLAGYNSADLSAAEAASLTGFKTASQLLTEEAEERDRRYQQQRGGPGSYGERLD